MKEIRSVCSINEKKFPINFNVMPLRQLQILGRKVFRLQP
jgi:hypothetical protein